jgi:hypothetical protein
MHSTPNLTRARFWGAALLILASAAPASAGPESYAHSGANKWAAYKYIDFGSRIPASRGDWQYGFIAFEPGQPALQAASFTLSNSSTTEGACFELVLGPPDNHPADDGALGTVTYIYNPDLFAYKKNFSIEDSSSTKQITKRIYLRNGWVSVYVAAASGRPQLGVWIKQAPLTESQCVSVTGNQTWVKVIDNRYTWGPHFTDTAPDGWD